MLTKMDLHNGCLGHTFHLSCWRRWRIRVFLLFKSVAFLVVSLPCSFRWERCSTMGAFVKMVIPVMALQFKWRWKWFWRRTFKAHPNFNSMRKALVVLQSLFGTKFSAAADTLPLCLLLLLFLVCVCIRCIREAWWWHVCHASLVCLKEVAGEPDYLGQT